MVPDMIHHYEIHYYGQRVESEVAVANEQSPIVVEYVIRHRSGFENWSVLYTQKPGLADAIDDIEERIAFGPEDWEIEA